MKQIIILIVITFLGLNGRAQAGDITIDKNEFLLGAGTLIVSASMGTVASIYAIKAVSGKKTLQPLRSSEPTRSD